MSERKPNFLFQCAGTEYLLLLCDLFLEIPQGHLEDRLYRQFLSLHFGISLILQWLADRIPGTTLNRLCVIACLASREQAGFQRLVDAIEQDWSILLLLLFSCFFSSSFAFLAAFSCIEMKLPHGGIQPSGGSTPSPLCDTTSLESFLKVQHKHSQMYIKEENKCILYKKLTLYQIRCFTKFNKHALFFDFGFFPPFLLKEEVIK